KAFHPRPWSGPPLLHDLAFSPDGRRLAAVNRDQVTLWDVETGQEVLVLRGAPPRAGDPAFNPRVAWSADGRRLAATNWNDTVSIWDATDQTTPAARSLRRQAAAERAYTWHLHGATATQPEAAAARPYHERFLEANEPPSVPQRLERAEWYLQRRAW